jgi:hypothetical protein
MAQKWHIASIARTQVIDWRGGRAVQGAGLEFGLAQKKAPEYRGLTLSGEETQSNLRHDFGTLNRHRFSSMG